MFCGRVMRGAKGRRVLCQRCREQAVFEGSISFTYRSIKIFNQAASLAILRALPLLLDDAGLVGAALGWSVMNCRYSASAAGTKRIHAGSIGGQFLVDSLKVPLAFAAAILSGTTQRETYQLKRGESAGSLATA